MPVFSYTARDSNGSLTHGTQDAPDQFAAVRILQSRKLLVTKLSALSDDPQTGDSPKKRKLHSRVKIADLLFFIRQTGTLLEAGIPLLRSIEVIALQTDSKGLQEILHTIIKDIKAGDSFMKAVSKHPKTFPGFWTYLIEAGESSGNLSVVLNQLGEYIEDSIKLKNKIISSLMYPAVIICVAIAAICVFLLVVIPMFSKLYRNAHAQLPFLTQAVIGVSEIFQHFFLLVVGVIAAAVWMLRRYFSTPKGARVKDELIINLPLFGPAMREAILARVFMNLAILIKGGVSLNQSISIAAKTAGNSLFANVLKNIEDDIKHGKTLSSAFSKNDMFPPMIVQMIAIGEESGRLPDMLGRITEHYEAKVDIFFSRLGTLIEPLTLIMVGALIAVLVVAMFLPIFSLGSIMK